MNLIYKDNNFKILIDFYKKPAVIELYENYNGNITHITVNGDYIDGDKNKAIKLYEWLESSKKEFEDIIWVSRVDLKFPPTAALLQIKFGISVILSILTCRFLRHVFICLLTICFLSPIVFL